MRLRGGGGLWVVIIITGPGNAGRESWFIAVVFRILCLLPKLGVREFRARIAEPKRPQKIINLNFVLKAANVIKYCPLDRFNYIKLLNSINY